MSEKQLHLEPEALKRFLAAFIKESSEGVIDMEITGFMAVLKNGTALSFDHLAVNMQKRKAPARVAAGKLSLVAVDGEVTA